MSAGPRAPFLDALESRDLEDAEKLLLLYGLRSDLARIRDIISQFAEALDDPGRLEMWDSMVRRFHTSR